MAAEETVQALTALTVIGGIAFILLMIFNINAFVKFLRRDKTEGADDAKQHSGLFWAVDGIVTFMFSLDFLSLLIFLI
ncbi:MAG: hypothetical protein ACPGGE_07255 [Poseidonia sp.]